LFGAKTPILRDFVLAGSLPPRYDRTKCAFAQRLPQLCSPSLFWHSRLAENGTT